MIGTILVPLDGSPLAQQGVYAACRVARETGAELLLLTAVPFSVHAGADERRKELAALAEARQHLLYHQQAVAQTGITARILLLPGDPIRAILFAAENEGVGLISMATHGRSGLRQVLLGSVAAAVVRDTRLPILLSRVREWPPLHKSTPYRRILIPLEGTPFAEAALRYSQAQGLGRAGELLLLRAVKCAQIQAVGPMVPGEEIMSLYESAEQENARRLQEADAYLRGLGATHLQDQPYRMVVATDTPASAIADTIERDCADLVVLATHDRHGVDRLLHGSVAQAVLQHAKVPVLLLHGASDATKLEVAATNQQAEEPAPIDVRREQIVQDQLGHVTVDSTRL
ncbi:MAG: UspA domain protein [Chloroflexi bacterium]|nr:UspA domain protein [Chloroflexota bacterium]